MIEQQGRVVGARNGKATVRLGGQSGCPACDAGEGCGAGIFGRLLRRREVEIELENPGRARPGEAVVVGMPEKRFLGLVGRLFAAPLLAGLAGAAAAAALAASWAGTTAAYGLSQATVVDLLTAAGGIAAAALVFARVRRRLPRSLDSLSLRLIAGVRDTTCNASGRDI